MVEAPKTIALPIFTRVNGQEVDLGTIDVPVDVGSLLAAQTGARPGQPVVDVTDFDTPPGQRAYQIVDRWPPASGSWTEQADLPVPGRAD